MINPRRVINHPDDLPRHVDSPTRAVSPMEVERYAWRIGDLIRARRWERSRFEAAFIFIGRQRAVIDLPIDHFNRYPFISRVAHCAGRAWNILYFGGWFGSIAPARRRASKSPTRRGILHCVTFPFPRKHPQRRQTQLQENVIGL